MSYEISFTSPGNPLPKQSYRHSGNGGYTPARIKSWQECVQIHAINARNLHTKELPDDVFESSEFEVHIQFYRKDKRRVDLDNMSKAILDALNNVMWDDDKQVTKLTLEKFYDKENPRAYIRVKER